MGKKSRFIIILMTIVIFGTILGIISMSLGSYEISPMRVFLTLIGKGTSLEKIAIFNLRLPRIFIAIIVGVALSISGAILQGITKNDLADPGILGINAGASLAAVLFIGYGGAEYYEDLGTLSVFALPFVAMTGAMAAAFIIYVLAWKKGINPIRLVLIGVGINSGINAIITLYQLNFENKDFNRVLVWTSGSLWGSSWKYFNVIAPIILLVLLLVSRKLKILDILHLGDEVATGLGVRVERERTKLLCYAVALAGLATAVSGSIGFLGLISPHIARRLVGPTHKRLIPVSAAISVCIILFADTLSRNLFAPIEIPVGITIALIGVPYFIYLMLRGDSNV